MTLIDLTTPVARSSRLDTLPVAIIGAGPIGLAAAAELIERGVDFVIYEAGATPAESVRSWGHIRLFSPWQELIGPAAGRLLDAAGWTRPADGVAPYGAELVTDYLDHLAALPAIASRMLFGTRVVAVTREGMDRTRSANRAGTPFSLRLIGADGSVSDVAARAVIDSSGTYTTPNSIGSSGLDPLGMDTIAGHVAAALPDVLGTERARFAGKHSVVVGAGHSAANTLINLAKLSREEPGTAVTWVLRNASAVRLTSSDDDGLPGRASLGQRVDRLVTTGAIAVVDRFEIVEVGASQTGITITGRRGEGVESFDADLIVNATGFRPNVDMLREIRLDLDDIVEAPRNLAPLIDPNVHTCGTVEPHGFAELQQPERNFFIAGMKSYGRAPTFLLATGYEQVRSIAAYLAGDLAAATKVDLVLPATGVCSTEQNSSSCCS